MEQKTYLVKLTSDQINIIGAALVEMPFKNVNQLINEIQIQINEQEKEDTKDKVTE